MTPQQTLRLYTNLDLDTELDSPNNKRFPSQMGKNFSFCNSCFGSLQLDEAYANEIIHDIHKANTLFR